MFIESHPVQIEWNAELYDSKHAFVPQFGRSLVKLLASRPGEHILDLGCGTGHLTQEIAGYGAEVIGIDSAAVMIEQARRHYPNLRFEVGDATRLEFLACFDAVFSNAVLHWIREPEKVGAGVWHSLKPGGRFVAEFGGKGNVQTIVSAIFKTMQAVNGAAKEPANLWYFPSIGEYSTLLEKQGFQVTFATLFDRPTPLEDGEQGMRNWLKMFANNFFQAIPANQQIEIMTDIENQLRPKLYQNGTWHVDYRRIQVVASKPTA